MPAHFDITEHYPENVERVLKPLLKPVDLCIEQYNRIVDGRPLKHLDLIQSSFNDQPFSGLDIRSKQNGFVQTVTQAYNDHHHLIIRPDDVWIAILSQFSIFINKNEEQFRNKFVAHGGKKRLVVTMPGNQNQVDFGPLAEQMTYLMQDNILDPDLRKWILPDFTTSTKNDTVVCAVMMMATMKSYFDYEMSKCGIPEVTLQGERSDWVSLRLRVERLTDFGDEPTKWLLLLRPVLDHFIGVFDGKGDVEFWNKVSVNYSLGSSLDYLSGWITAFCAWDNEGNWQGKPETEACVRFGITHKHQNREIDGVVYPTIHTERVPVGFCHVDVRVVDDDGTVDCAMMSGHMSTLVEGARRDTVRALPSWFMFVTPAKEQETEPELSPTTAITNNGPIRNEMGYYYSEQPDIRPDHPRNTLLGKTH